jgi:hypothetical protein
LPLPIISLTSVFVSACTASTFDEEAEPEVDEEAPLAVMAVRVWREATMDETMSWWC